MILESIKKDYLNARKNRDEAAKADLVGVIVTVEERIKKNPESAVPDSEAIAVIKNQVKVIRREIDAWIESGIMTEYPKTIQETIDRLEGYLPRFLSEHELTEVIVSFELDNLGAIMKELKNRSIRDGFSYDGKYASLIARDIIDAD